MKNGEENYFTIRLHRWQPRQSRFKIQTFTVSADGGESYLAVFDLLTGRSQAQHEPGLKQVLARTQQIDRVQFDAFNYTLSVWLSPIVSRQENKQPRASIAQPGKASSFTRRASTVAHVCECFHRNEDHKAISYGSRWGVCLVPGCNCQEYIERIEKFKLIKLEYKQGGSAQ